MLVGLPGVGKTTVGRAVAERMGRQFLDFDEMIERREGMPIGRIFAELGEPYFRKRERELSAELRGATPAVLAPGGGWIENAEVVAMLRPPARLAYLQASPQTVLQRMGDLRQRRPLLTGGDPEVALTQLYARRQTLYEGADWVIDTETLGIEKVIDAVVQLVAHGAAP